MPPLPAWVADYIGIPYRALGRARDGLDCWGLVRLVYAEQKGIALPAYDGRGFSGGRGTATRASVADTAALVAEAQRTSWREVPRASAAVLDVVLLRVHGQPIHVGVVVAPGAMLHSLAGHDSAVERLDGMAWANRLMGFWRWSPTTPP